MVDELRAIAQDLVAGNPRTATTREVLSWYGYRRRGSWIVRRIRQDLNALDLSTDPDIESAWIDQSLKFETAPPVVEDRSTTETTHETPSAQELPISEILDDDLRPGDVELREPVPRLGNVKAADRKPICVNRNTSLSEAMTVMIFNDFSQLPVMSRPDARTVDGMISWATIGMSQLAGRKPKTVGECMDTNPKVLMATVPLLSAVREILNHGAVLVQARDRTIQGIVTSDDIGVEFVELTEAFLLLGEIENHLRTLIAPKFTPQDLATARDPGDTRRTIESVDDLTFGEYVRLLENPGNWSRLKTGVDRAIFCKMLVDVTTIRNDVMHFHPDGISVSDKDMLRMAVRFLQNLTSNMG